MLHAQLAIHSFIHSVRLGVDFSRYDHLLMISCLCNLAQLFAAVCRHGHVDCCSWPYGCFNAISCRGCCGVQAQARTLSCTCSGTNAQLTGFGQSTAQTYVPLTPFVFLSKAGPVPMCLTFLHVMHAILSLWTDSTSDTAAFTFVFTWPFPVGRAQRHDQHITVQKLIISSGAWPCWHRFAQPPHIIYPGTL